MVISPYSTSTGKMYANSIANVLFSIQQNEKSTTGAVVHYIRDEFNRDDILMPEGVMLVTAEADNVSPFGHPIVSGVVEKGEAKFLQSNRFDNTVYIDGRGFTSITRERVLKLNDRDEFEMSMVRAGLTSYAARNDIADLLSLGNFPLQVWIRWLTDIITRRTGLAPNYQRNVSVIIGVYYFSLFANLEVLEGDYRQLPEKEKIKIARAIQSVTSIPSELTFEILDKLKAMNDLEDLAEALVNHSGAISLSAIGAGTLRAMVAGSWMGANSKEVAAIALEHAPTFFAMVFRALRSRTHSKTLLGTAAVLANKHKDGDQWMKGLLSLPGVVPKSYS